MISSHDSVRDALGFIPASDRDTWVRMGMAVKAELGEDGFDVWDTWSRSGESYDAHDVRDVWKSIRAGGEVTCGTLFYEAKARGWVNGSHISLSPDEIAERKRAHAARAARDEAETARKHAAAAEKAEGIWKAAGTAPGNFAYLARKGIQAHGARFHDGTLVVPMRTADGVLRSLQFIDAEGGKRFLPGGQTVGCYFGFGTTKDAAALCIAEGFATGATIHEATGYPVAVAFTAGNVMAVAQALRAKYPDLPLILCADDDYRTQGNTGITKATEAARAVGGKVAIPDFGADRPEKATDFNDVLAQRGAGAVRRAIEQAQAPAPVTRDEDGASVVVLSGEDELAIPTPLPKLPPVPEFPLEILPRDLYPWVADAAERARFRPDFAAVSGMAALGSLIGRKLGIRLKQHDSWTEYGNIWAALVGDPGALKSPAQRDALRPLKALQVAADEKHQAELEKYATRLEAFKLRREARKKSTVAALAKNPGAEIDLGSDGEPEAPVARTYWTSDATAEKLGVLLAENPNGLLVERDELSSLLAMLEDERGATMRGLFLSGWSGNEGYRFDRIQRGTTLIPKFALTVVGGIQPGPLARYVRGAFSGERADGLLQRFQLIVWPDPAPFEYVDRLPNSRARQAVADLFDRADKMDAGIIGHRDDFGDGPPFIHLSPPAQALFVEWYSGFMRALRTPEGGESAPMIAHLGKYPGLVGKLALITHVADDPNAKEVSEPTLLKALAWVESLTQHARRVYHAANHPETGAAELLLARLRRNDLPATFKARDIYRKAWHGLTDSDAVKKACHLLFDYGWLIQIDGGGAQGAGRPADPVYAVSPAVRTLP